MADLIDQAQVREAQFLAAAMARRTPIAEVPEGIAIGCTYCIACGVLIPEARLRAVQGACRCAGCQAQFDVRGRDD